MNSRQSVLAAIAAVLCLAVPTTAALAAPRSPSTGVYADGDGGRQNWEINDNHALIWGGRPFAPVGAVFQSRFLSAKPSDDNWTADVSTLRKLKSAGITSLLVRPTGPAGTLDDLPTATIQAMLDVLDASGFTYGIDLAGSTGNEWTAALINPAVYRSPAPARGATVTFRNLADIVEADYFLVSSVDSHVITRGQATIVDKETVSVTLPSGMGGDGTVLLLYPQARMSPDGVEGRRIPDVWSDADGNRDAMLVFMNRVRFGKGLRFFVDPLQIGSALFTEADGGIIPVSDNFRIQFQAWLAKKYSNSVVQMRAAWGVKNNDVTDFALAARCEPLWFQTRGLAQLSDPATGRTFEVIPSTSRYWRDVREFELAAIQRAMSGMADALKYGVANVPVLYTWSRLSPVFVNQGPNGFDGLMVDANGHGDDLTLGTGYAYASLEQARRMQWFVARVGVNPAPTGGSAAGQAGNARHASLTADRAALESVGVKAVYVSAPPGEEGDAAGGTPWLGWVREAASSRGTEAASFVATKPRVIFYPINIPLFHPEVQQFGQNTWWLPTFQNGDEADLGRKLRGYSLTNSAGLRTFVIWSADGLHVDEKFRFPRGTEPDVRLPSGESVPVADAKGFVAIQFGAEPRLVSNITAMPLPEGAVNDEMTEATRLIDLGTRSKVPVDAYAQRLFYIHNTIMASKNIDLDPPYQMVRAIIEQLRQVLMPYTWMEGEAASQQSFESVVSSPDASGKSFLWVDTLRDPPGSDTGSYYALYKLITNAPGEYTIWAALAPGTPGSDATSPVVLRVDAQPAIDISHPMVAGDRYGTLPFPNAPEGGAFTWCNLGSVQLTAGPHRLLISLSGRAPGTNRYTLGIDALVLTRAPFVPHGIDKPAF